MISTRNSIKRSILLIFLLFILSVCIGQKFEQLALTPPMGWNSWNKFGCDINEKIIRETADAIVSSGMKDAGYGYVIIDDCWQTSRDSLGFIIADPQKFPSGIKALSDYVHSRGLKFGIYSCAGRKTCQNRPGSRGHEFQDALSYAKWGVDFLKSDWCNTEGQNAVESYALMRDALYSAGRPILLSICEWGLNKPWEWAGEVGHMWRTTGDIQNNWNIPDAKEGKCWAGGVVINLDMQQGLEKYAGPGHWNDPDMLEIGNGVLTPAESRAHFSLWCMLASPLIAGNDIRSMDEAIKLLLSNKELISIDQDPLGKQGFKIRDYGEIEIYYKPLEHGDAAICIFNRLDVPVKFRLDLGTMKLEAYSIDDRQIFLQASIDRQGFGSNKIYKVRDVLNKKDVTALNNAISSIVDGHDVYVLRLKIQ